MNVSSKSRIIVYIVIIAVLVIVGLFGAESVFGPRESVVEMFPVTSESPAVQSGVVVPAPQHTPSGRRAKKRSARRDASFEQQLRALKSGEVGVADSEAGSQGGSNGPISEIIGRSTQDQSSTGALSDDVASVKGTAGTQERTSKDDDVSNEDPLDFLGGIMVSNNTGLQAVVTPQVTPQTGRPWVRGQARGYTMLSAMQPEARVVVETQVETLLSAKIREPYIGVLIDGTFGRDFTYLKDVIERLSGDGRALTLALYLTNGPTMRKWRETPIDALFSRINPSDFRQRIRREQQLQAQFLAVVLQAKDVFEFNISLNSGNNNVAIVMLEDNLDSFAYRAMREIASAEIGSLAGFIRNPCLGCYEGNDDITLGDPREEHKLERYNILKRGDAYSLDGLGFSYPDGSGNGLAAAQLRDLMVNSYSRGLRYVGLWRYEWQGLEFGGGNPRPETRTHTPSNPDQQEFEIEMLREGLVAETDGISVDDEL